MKLLILSCFVAFASARTLLGQNRCTWGPAYWCKSLRNAHECGAGAVVHCAKVWPKQSKGETCSICKEAVSVIHSLLASNGTETEIIDGLKEICSLLGSMSSECTALIDSYGTEIIALVEQYTANPAAICNMIGLCQTSGRKPVPLTKLKPAETVTLQRGLPLMPGPFVAKPVNVKNGVTCEVCTLVMTELDNLITKKSTQEEIEAALDKVCSMLPSSISLKCQELVNTFGPAILNILSQYADPKVVCNMLGLCTSANDAVAFTSMAKKVEGGLPCEVCTVAVGYIDNMLKDQKTEAEIIAAIDQVCKVIPNEAIANECTQLIDQYGKQIIALLANELSPDAVCKELGLCGASKELKTELIQSGIECTLCETAVGYLDSMLKNNATEGEIVAVLDKLCSYLPGQFQSTCTELVNEYVPYLCKMLESQSPETVCTLLQLCQAKSTKQVVKPLITMPKLKSGELCEVCDMAVGYIDTMLKDKKEVAQIVEMMDSFCNYLPTSIQTECQTFVKTYVQEVINMLVNMPADQVCKSLGLCTSSKNVLVGGKKCTWGPSYWCSSKSAAKACKAFEHCEARKWLI